MFLTAVFEFELKQIGFQMFILAYFHLSLFQKYISMCLFLRSLVNYVNHPQTSFVNRRLVFLRRPLLLENLKILRALFRTQRFQSFPSRFTKGN